MGKLALLGGKPVLTQAEERMFHWPIVNDAMRAAQAKVLEDGNMSGTDIARRFEEKFAEWQGTKFALSHNNGTSALTAAMYAVGLGRGDEIVCTSVTYWASCLGALQLGAEVVLCDIDPKTLQMDPASLEEHITPRTKAVMVVHYMAHPAPMDEIMAIARRHGLKVIEDVSHAQGGHYRGRMLGTFGDVAGMSLMSGKSFAIGEGGMLVTDDREIYRKAVRWGHYDRIPAVFKPEEYADTLNLPLGGCKNRMHQVSAAVGIEQLGKYDAECAEIDRAMKYFWQGLSDVCGVAMIYPEEEGSDKSGWYASRFLYDPEVFGGVSNITFCAALNAEVGGQFTAGCNMPLHLSSLFDGTKETTGALPVADGINARVLGEPWFKHFEPSKIDPYVEAVRKVVAHASELLAVNDAADFKGGTALTHRRG